MPAPKYFYFRISLLIFCSVCIYNMVEAGGGVEKKTVEKEGTDSFAGSSESSAPEKETPENHASDELAQDIMLKEAEKLLRNRVPKVPKAKIPGEKAEAEKIIVQANDNALNAQSSILALIADSEKARLEKQKPVLYWVIAFVGSQLLAFNAIIALVIWSAATNSSNGNFALIFEFLKYYIGAVLVELIGMIVFITQSTFKSVTKQMLKIVSDNGKFDEK